jgi:hypothetical protein
MNHSQVGKHWNHIASTWTVMVRAGYDFYRDHFNTPAFLDLLPNYWANTSNSRYSSGT